MPSLIKGYPGFTLNGQPAKDLNILAIRLADLDEVQAPAREITVSAVKELPAETIALGQARRRTTPGGQVLFAPAHPRQKYHSKSYAKVARRLKASLTSPSLCICAYTQRGHKLNF